MLMRKHFDYLTIDNVDIVDNNHVNYVINDFVS